MYFLDTGLGSGWWVMVLYLALLFAVMVVRGKPYGAEQIVTVLFPKRVCCSAWLGPLLAFTWNVVLPIALLIMAVVTFKTGMVAEMFNWSLTEGYIYLPSWVREIGSMMQVMPLLVGGFIYFEVRRSAPVGPGAEDRCMIDALNRRYAAALRGHF